MSTVDDKKIVSMCVRACEDSVSCAGSWRGAPPRGRRGFVLQTRSNHDTAATMQVLAPQLQEDTPHAKLIARQAALGARRHRCRLCLSTPSQVRHKAVLVVDMAAWSGCQAVFHRVQAHRTLPHGIVRAATAR